MPRSCLRLGRLGPRLAIQNNRRGVGTIVPKADGVVYGVIWLISPSDERALDSHEGVGRGLYRQDPIEAHILGRPPFEALVYLANDAQPGAVRPGYLETIIAAAIVHDLPRDYIQELKTWSMTSG